VDLTGLAVQLISGTVGGNVAGGLFKNISLGTLGNSIAGIGGGLGGQILSMLGVGDAEAAGSLDLSSILTSVAGGGVLLAVVGVVKKLFSK